LSVPQIPNHQTPNPKSQTLNPGPKILLFEAPTGYGKTGCVLEFALGQLQSGRFSRLIWLTGKSTGQLQVVRTLEQMTSSGRRPCLPNDMTQQAGTPVATSNSTPTTSSLIDYKPALAFWQIRNKAEHCVNHTYHCVRDGCDYLKGGAERWPASGLSRYYLNENEPRDLGTLRAAGRAAQICPYEITRTALAFNDVWIGDYNYVFAPDNRGLFFDQPGFDPRTTLLAIDEAHNLPTRVADAYSHRANDNDARLLFAELDHLRAPGPLLLAVEEWTMLLAALQPTDAIDAALESELHDCIEKIVRLTQSLPLDYAALGPKHSETLWQFVALDEFLANPNLRRLLWCPRVGELNFTCIDATAAIGETLGRFGGAILMSATLQPYTTMAAACGIAAPTSYATLHAPAPWRENAYDVAVDTRVETTFKQRANYYGTTAATIEAMHAASNKAAIAVFFPSYAYAESVLRALENSGSVLRVALQPKLPDLAAQNAWVEESLALTDALFLVLGSSFAEGIDLLGGRVTHAMVVGPALPEVNAVQKARLDTFSGLGREAAFRRVYQIPGLQKVNQALGRLVRAPGQKAKVLLHCRRFADTSYNSLLAMEYQFYREVGSEMELQDWLSVSTAAP
jgi:Rad3-related DNA helicase